MRVGIDLGTTYSVMAYVNPVTKRPEIIKNRWQGHLTPTVLAFLPDKVLYGEEALEYREQGQAVFVSHFKRHMGSAEYSYSIGEKIYTATDFAALFLKFFIEDAQIETGEKITEAVITVPAYFGHKEREATIEAARKAKLSVLHLINEPTAAAFSYGLCCKEETKTVLVYDLGGGTFDAAVVKMGHSDIRILGSDGNRELGGKEWDDIIARYLCDSFYQEFGMDISLDPGETTHILSIAENMKKRLSAANRAECSITYRGKTGHYAITIDMFNNLSKALFDETKHITARLLSSLSLQNKQIDGVLLVGGSTRMRQVKEYCTALSHGHLLGGIHADEAVAIGAAIRADQCEKEYKGLLPDLSSKEKEKIRFEDRIPGAKRLKETTAHSLGMVSISVDGSFYVNSIIIKKNSPIPISNTRSYKLATNYNYNELAVYLVQGETEELSLYQIVGKYVFSGIVATESGNAVLHVTYSYTEEGTIQVTAMQEGYATKLPLRIQELESDLSWLKEVPELKCIKGPEAPKGILYLAVDLSGSMSGQPLLKAKQAIMSFLKKLDRRYLATGVIGFADKVQLLLSPTKDDGPLEQAIANMRVDGNRFGYGNGANPFALAYEAAKETDETVYLVVLTDGVWTYQDIAIKEAKRCRKEGVQIHALGFGCADEEFIKKIAGSRLFGEMTDIKDLDKSFTKIAQVMV